MGKMSSSYHAPASVVASSVWTEAVPGSYGAGTAGFVLGNLGDTWATAVPGAYAVGSAGYILGTNLNATVSSRSSHTAASVWAVATRQLTGTQTFDLTGNITGNLSGSVGSVTGAVGSVTGNVGGNVTGSVGSVVGAVGSVTGAVGSVTGNVGGNLVGNVNGNVAGSVGSVTGAVGSVTGAVGSVTGAVGSVTGAVGSVTGNVGGDIIGGLGGYEGTLVSKAFTIDGPLTQQDNLFEVTGTVRILAIWGEVTESTNDTTVNVFKFSLYDSVVTLDITGALDLGGQLPVGAVVFKTLVNTSGINFLEPASVAGFYEPGTTIKTAFKEFWVQKSAINDTYIRAEFSGDVSTNVDMTVYIRYVPITADGAIAAV